MKQKIYQFLHSGYAWLITISIFASLLSVVGFIVAVIIGGEAGAALATFLYKKYLAGVMFVAAVGMFMGLIALYVSNQHALSMKTEGANQEEKN